MIELELLPASLAKPLVDVPSLDAYKNIKFTGFVDERTLLTDINERLNKLETSTETNREELDLIISLSEHFQGSIEDRDEILTRIDWLQRLYKANDEIHLIDTVKKVKLFRNLIASVQTCPMKRLLMTKLDSMESSLSEVKNSKADLSHTQLLMEQAINEIGDTFINLGKTARDQIITELFRQLGEKSSIEDVRKAAADLEEKVRLLKDVNDLTEFINRLEKLPLSSLSEVEVPKKAVIAGLLMKRNDWEGIVSLDKVILQLNKDITRREQEKFRRDNVIELHNGTEVAFVIDVRNQK